MNHTAGFRLAALSLLIFFQFNTQLKAQNKSIINREISNIYKLYDSSVYLAFNTLYDYSTDTVLDKYYKHETLQGEYSMYGSRCFYRIGNIDYLRNDSFSIAAYNDDKFLVASRVNQVRGSSGILPMRDMMDSLMNAYADHYTVNLTDSLVKDIEDTLVDTLKVIRFTRLPNDTGASYNYINIAYNPDSYSLNYFEYGLVQPAEIPEEDSASILYRNYDSTSNKPLPINSLNWNVNFRISFKDYQIGVADYQIFSEARMIHEEHPGTWTPAGKYAGYTIYWATDKVPKHIED